MMTSITTCFSVCISTAEFDKCNNCIFCKTVSLHQSTKLQKMVKFQFFCSTVTIKSSVHLIHSNSLGLQAIMALSLFYTLSFHCCTCTRFSAFTSHILATDLSHSHCNFNSHMKSSWHSLIPFLPFLLNRLGLPSPELDQILF
jgi:hypothetical protein